jgi:hypothetical protein
MPVKCVKQGTNSEISQFKYRTSEGLSSQRCRVCVWGVPPSLTASQRRGWWHRSYRLGGTTRRSKTPLQHSAPSPQNPSWAPRTPAAWPVFSPTQGCTSHRKGGRYCPTWWVTKDHSPPIGSPWPACPSKSPEAPMCQQFTYSEQLSGKCLKKISRQQRKLE